MVSGVERPASAERALDKVETGLKIADSILELGENSGLPLLPAVCSAARGVLEVVQTVIASQTVITDALSIAQRTIDVLELLQLMAQNVERMDVSSRARVEGPMRELQRLLEDVRSAVDALGKKGWLRHALKVKRHIAEITDQIELLLKLYNLARDAYTLDRLQAREDRSRREQAEEARARQKEEERARKEAAARKPDWLTVPASTAAPRSLLISAPAPAPGVTPGGARSTPALTRSAIELLRAWELRDVDLERGDHIGGGGQALVLRGRWQGLEVAIKQPPAGLPAPSASEFVRREVRALSRMRHPNVVQLYGVVSDPQPCVVMALARRSLRDVIALGGAAPPVHEMVALLAGVARGMSAVHAHKIIHLDLKPENVLLGPRGEAWVTDFGLAVSSLSKSVSKDAAGRGTLGYKAPELFRDEDDGGAILSPAADVFAFGVVAWEVLVRQPLWWSASQSRPMQDPEIMRSLDRGKRPAMRDGSDWRAALPPPLSAGIDAWWAQEHETRPAFEAIAEQLDKITADLSSKAPSRSADEAVAAKEAALRRALAAEEELAAVRAQKAEYEAAVAAAANGEVAARRAAEELQGEVAGLRIAVATAEREKAAAEKAFRATPDADHTAMLQQLLDGQAELRSRNTEAAEYLQRLLAGQERQQRTLSALAMGELDCPRIPWLQPVPPRGLVARLKPAAWFTDTYTLHFVCPVNLTLASTCDGEGYALTMPKKWVMKYGPAIKAAIAALQVAAAAGRVVGLPLPALPSAKELITQCEREALQALESVVGEKFLKIGLAEKMETGMQAVIDAFDAASEMPEHSITKARPAVDASYRALKQLVAEQCKDPQLLRTGLVKAEGKDGSFDWVCPDAKARYEREGRAALFGGPGEQFL